MDPTAFAEGFRYSGAFGGEMTADWLDSSGRPHRVSCHCGEQYLAAVGCNGPSDSVAALFVCGHINSAVPLLAADIVNRANTGFWSGTRRL